MAKAEASVEELVGVIERGELRELEAKVGTHDTEIQLIIKALKGLMAEPEKKKKPTASPPRKPRGCTGSR
jgi:hypothetical protein